MERSLKKLLIMIVPTFVDLQGFIVGSWFVVKEVLKEGSVLFHYIFASPLLWKLLTNSEKPCASWLIANHYRLQWETEMVRTAWRDILLHRLWLISKTMTLSYMLRDQKRKWLKDMLESDARDDIIIEILEADYEDTKSLINLDIINTMRCNKYIKNYALHNVFKIFNWWSQRQKKIFFK